MLKNFIIGLMMIVIIILGFNSYKSPDIVCKHLQKVDSLQNVVDSLKLLEPEIKYKTDSVKVEIIKIQKDYESNYNNVVNQSLTSDIKFFSDYISSYN